ncbi:tetratricopeptide repeat protein [Streptomyces sp. NPDC006733]|uniref:PIN domain-containing protein n=1 Tax=Streptomyces sp. NPDC006733 TaxID=3155460 RepID=UPI0033C6B0F8
MTSQPRRSYTNATIAGLMTLARGACYWPGCGEPVIRMVGAEPMLNLEIAHIRAFESGGPRFDPAWTVKQRNSFVNLMLLCTPHHKTVDGPNRALYPVELLEGWKHDREAEGQDALAGLRDLSEEHLLGMCTALRDELVAVLEEIASSGHEILHRLDARTDFQAGLQTLNLRAQEEAQALTGAWPAVEQAVGLLQSCPTEREALLRQWADRFPRWMEKAPPQAFAWLAQLAADYEAHQASVTFFQRCIDDGGFPRDLWVARAAQQLSAAGSDQDARDFLVTNNHPSSPLLLGTLTLLDSDWKKALGHLASWAPATPTARAFKAGLEAHALTSTGQDAAALARLRAADPDDTLSGIQYLSALILLDRAVRGRSEHRLADARNALTLAIKARDGRRTWFGDSVGPTVVAVRAAQLCGDAAIAWGLTQEQPEGQALAREASDARLIEHRAALAALTGRVEQAQRLQSQVESAYVRAQITAMLLEREAGGQIGTPQVQSAWRAVWDAATTEQEQLQAAMGMAQCGTQPADLDRLDGAHPELVAEIRLITRALTASSTGDLSVLRANVTKSRIIVIALAQRYQISGERELRARTLRSGAEHWRDAFLMAMAADAYRHADLPGQTKACAREALALAGPGWAAQGEMYALLVEAELAEGNTDRATDAARNMLALDPHDHNARWALVRCHVARGLFEDAWNVLAYQGTPIEPRTGHEALVWVKLGARHCGEANFTGQALALMQRWPDDEELLGAFIATLHLSAAGTPERWSENDARQLNEATADYLQRFPDSSQFRAVKMGPGDDPLVNVAEELRQAHESIKDVQSKVAAGDLPLGPLTWVAGRSYTELSLRRGAGFVYAGDAQTAGAGAEAVTTARSLRTVIDPTAAHTLALLDPGHAERLIGSLEEVVTTDQLFQDALHAKESLALQSELTLGWDEAGQRAQAHIDEAANVQWLRSMSIRVVEVLRSVARVPRPELRRFPLPGTHGTEWLTAPDYAKEHGLVLWSDDRVLRAIARAEQIPTFGTLDLLDATTAVGQFSTHQALLIKADLLRNHYVDIEFSTNLYEAAALADGWQAKAVANALSRPQAWTQPQSAASFVLECVSHISEHRPHDISQWLAAASTGLARASVPGAANQNLKALVWQVLTQPWVNTSSLPFILTGLRCGLAVRDDAGLPLEEALAQFYAALVARSGHVVAASQLMKLYKIAPDAEKAAAARVVLTHPGN